MTRNASSRRLTVAWQATQSARAQPMVQNDAAIIDALRSAPFAVCVMDAGWNVIWSNSAYTECNLPEQAIGIVAATADLGTGNLTERVSEIDGLPWRTSVAALQGSCDQGRFLVTVTPLTRLNSVAIEIEQRLSPVELRLAERICAGDNLRQASEALRISYHTARKYMQTIFRKTGARRQSDLVARMLCTGVARDLPTDPPPPNPN